MDSADSNKGTISKRLCADALIGANILWYLAKFNMQQLVMGQLCLWIASTRTRRPFQRDSVKILGLVQKYYGVQSSSDMQQLAMLLTTGAVRSRGWGSGKASRHHLTKGCLLLCCSLGGGMRCVHSNVSWYYGTFWHAVIPHRLCRIVRWDRCM